MALLPTREKTRVPPCPSFSLTSPPGEREQLYSEMEIMIPVESLSDTLAAFIKQLDDPSARVQHDPASCLLYVLVRFVGADDIPLSPFLGRNTAVLSMIVMGTAPGMSAPATETAFFTRLLQDTCVATCGAGARPHPGKINTFTAAMMAAAYPDTYGGFVDLRQRVDPTRLFANAYTDGLFGVY